MIFELSLRVKHSEKSKVRQFPEEDHINNRLLYERVSTFTNKETKDKNNVIQRINETKVP